MRTRSNSAAPRYKHTSDSDYSDTEHMSTNSGNGSSDEKPHPHHNPNAMPCCIKACSRYGTRLLGSLRSNWDLKQNHSGRVCEGHYRKSLRMYKKMQSLSNAAAKGSTTRKRKGSQGDGSTRVTRSQQHEPATMDMTEEMEAEEEEDDIDMADIPPTEASEEPAVYHHHQQQQQQQQQWTDQQRRYQQQQYGTVYPTNPQPYMAVTSIQQQQQQQQHYPSLYYGQSTTAHTDYHRYSDQQSLYQQQQQQQQQQYQQYNGHYPQKYGYYGQSTPQVQPNQTQVQQQVQQQQQQQLSRQSQTRNPLPRIQLDIERQPVNLVTSQHSIEGHIINGESGDSLVRNVINGNGSGNAAITPQTPEPWRRQFRQFCEFVLKSENVM